jgi:hypothetical protein
VCPPSRSEEELTAHPLKVFKYERGEQQTCFTGKDNLQKKRLLDPTERAGFDLPSLCKVLNNLILQLNSNDSKDLKSLVDLLFLHDFLLSQT